MADFNLRKIPMKKPTDQLNLFDEREWALLLVSQEHCLFDGSPISLLTHSRKGLCEEHVTGFLKNLTLFQWRSLFNTSGYPIVKHSKVL